MGMSRVIAGTAGGRRLYAPKAGVRPTTGRAKAALFSWLGETVRDARVLDLFAGTGSLGIEALSRGAGSALFVELAREACAVIERNLKATGLERNAHLRPGSVTSFLRGRGAQGGFDLIFCDPPWIERGADRDWVGWIYSQQDVPRLLAPGGWFILEAPTGRDLAAEDKAGLWTVHDKRVYGTTTLWFLRPGGNGGAKNEGDGAVECAAGEARENREAGDA